MTDTEKSEAWWLKLTVRDRDRLTKGRNPNELTANEIYQLWQLHKDD